MIRFNSDYTEGAHPKILEKLIETNLEQTSGYGMDPYCEKARGIIKEKCKDENLDVHFFVGGTQTNLTFISSVLRPYQGVVSVDTGHINTHESGAIEATGHKVLAVKGVNGKVTAEEVQRVYDEHYNDEVREHTVQPKMVYISNPTEIGTIYSKQELTKISEVCRKNNLILYMDGARLGYGLCAENNDLDLPTIAKLCDAFYIGGTKVGALFGEALVISKEALKEDFRYILKQKGGMLAKGRLLGLQFLTLFEKDLYFEISAHANNMARLIKEACIEKGYPFLTESTTNQQFPILPNKVLEELKENFEYSFWQKIDEEHCAVRFCTSWATDINDVNALVKAIKE